MSKYSKLAWYLQNIETDAAEFNFKTVEKILGFDLPRSARKYRPWWANDITHVQARDGWMSVDWSVSFVNMEKQYVTFLKKGWKKRAKRITVANNATSAHQFEAKARETMSEHLSTQLFPGKCDGVNKLFDMVSEDKMIVGDAKYYTMVRGTSRPPAKLSVISEHVWLLEKTKAKRKFLVFGNDRRVPELWLHDYGNLVAGVEFYFIDEGGRLEELKVVIGVGAGR